MKARMLAGEIKPECASDGKRSPRIERKFARDSADTVGAEQVSGCWLGNAQESILQKENRARRRDDHRRNVLTPGPGGHLLHHGDYQLAVAVVQVAGIASDLAQEAELVIRKLRHHLGVPVVIAGFGEELP